MRYRTRPSSSAGMPFTPAPLREGRTGLTMEQKTVYQRRLNTLMRRTCPRWWVLQNLDGGNRTPGEPVKEWGTVPARVETIALLKRLKAGHSATAMGPRVSLTEVLNAALAAGIPVLLREKGWSLGDDVEEPSE